MSTDIRALLEASMKTKQLRPSDIPELDLYMDQIISLMNTHLGNDGEKEPLTRTMIHNYSKAGVIAPVKGKKYSKEHILQMLAVYSLKNTLTITQIKRILSFPVSPKAAAVQRNWLTASIPSWNAGQSSVPS